MTEATIYLAMEENELAWTDAAEGFIDDLRFTSPRDGEKRYSDKAQALGEAYTSPRLPLLHTNSTEMPVRCVGRWQTFQAVTALRMVGGRGSTNGPHPQLFCIDGWL